MPILAALASSRLQICSANLIVPLLRWQATEDLARGRGAESAAFAARRTAFERAMFGDEAAVQRFRVWLATHARLVGDPRVTLFFASADRGSAAADLPAGVNMAGRVTILHGSHTSISYLPTLWNAVRSTIGADCVRPSQP